MATTMTIVIDRSMSPDEIQRLLSKLSSQAQKRKDKEFKLQRQKRRQAFGTAFLDVEDPVSLQRQRRDE